MIYSINFNNKNSYKDLELKIKSRPNIPIPEKNINVITIEGTNGDLVEDLGTYKPIPIPIQFNRISNNFHNDFRQIKAWLLNISDSKLCFVDDADYFYNVEYVKMDADIERKYKVLGNFTATFVCKPFSYSFAGLNSRTVTNNSYIINEGTYKADPIIYIEGSGTIQLYISNRELIINNLNGNITINSMLKEAYNSNYSNMNDSLNGDYPYLDVGKNLITWTGNITKINIVPNWCYL